MSFRSPTHPWPLRTAFPLALSILVGCAGAPRQNPAPGSPPVPLNTPPPDQGGPQGTNGSSWTNLGPGQGSPAPAPATSPSAAPVTHAFVACVATVNGNGALCLYDAGTGTVTALAVSGATEAQYVGYDRVLYLQGGTLDLYKLDQKASSGFFAPQVQGMYQVSAFGASAEGTSVAFVSAEQGSSNSQITDPGYPYGSTPYGNGYPLGSNTSANQPGVFLWNAGTFAELSKAVFAANNNGGVTRVSLSGDGKVMAFCTGDGSLYDMQVNGPLVEQLADSHTSGNAVDVRLDQAGAQLFWETSDGNYFRYDLTQHQNYSLRLPPGGSLAAMGFAPDDTQDLYLAAPDASGSLGVWSVNWLTMQSQEVATTSLPTSGGAPGGNPGNNPWL